MVQKSLDTRGCMLNTGWQVTFVTSCTKMQGLANNPFKGQCTNLYSVPVSVTLPETKHL